MTPPAPPTLEPTDDGKLRICEAFTVQDQEGRDVRVVAVDIFAEDHCCDVYVHLANGRALLAKDETFLKGVNDALRTAGYDGPSLGRGAWGAQQDHCLELEATHAFEVFAMSKGWTYAEGHDAWQAGKLILELPADSYVTFTASNQAVYAVPVYYIAERHAEAHAAEAGGMAAALKSITLPALRARPNVAAEWLREVLTWEQTAAALREIKPPPELDLKREFDFATLHTKGMAANKWRGTAQ